MDDLISRQAAIDALENTDCELSADAWDELTDAIMQVPSAQPERKNGRWLRQTYRINGSDDEMLGFYVCSECGMANWIKTDNFCHNCGADMRKETEDEYLSWELNAGTD